MLLLFGTRLGFREERLLPGNDEVEDRNAILEGTTFGAARLFGGVRLERFFEGFALVLLLQLEIALFGFR